MVSAGVAMVVLVVVAACGGGGKGDDPTIGAQGGAGATCTVSGTSLSIAADSIEFDKSCLAAPAGQDFTIEFANKESLPHNLAVYGPDPSAGPLWSGDVITGPKTVTYALKALAAGTYRFKCTVHPAQMKGTLVVA